MLHFRKNWRKNAWIVTFIVDLAQRILCQNVFGQNVFDQNAFVPNESGPKKSGQMWRSRISNFKRKVISCSHQAQLSDELIIISSYVRHDTKHCQKIKWLLHIWEAFIKCKNTYIMKTNNLPYNTESCCAVRVQKLKKTPALLARVIDMIMIILLSFRCSAKTSIS